MAIENRSQGFGDDLAKVAKKLGLDQIANHTAKALGMKDCGCGARQESLNDPDLLINKIFYKNKEDNEQG